MKAEVLLVVEGYWLVYIRDCEGGSMWDVLEFANEFSAQTYADAINMGVIQHVEAED